MKPNVNIMNILDEKAAVDVLTGRLPVKMIYRDKLAERLGVAPKERIALTLVVTGDILAVSVLLDGGDLTPAQNDIFMEFLRETGAFKKVIGVFPERPTTS
jgi:hypothetical protein